jgi:diaminobutyrate-2-oxoglutarate transaminase
MMNSHLPDVFQRRESEVRSYCRSFPAVFEKAHGAYLFDRDGNRYTDFFCGAGALNYGHNPPALKHTLLDYLASDGVVHSLDMATVAKQRFLEEFESIVLEPRNLDYRVQFVGPTGANAIEAALKLARKRQRRNTVVAFTNAYHGLSSGALSVTGDAFYRDESYLQRGNVVFMPYENYFGRNVDTLDYFERYLTDSGSGLDRPAAVILETVQAEGGVNVASVQWLRRLELLCRRFEMIMIVDDVQVGCGRTGTFFSFERAEWAADMVVLSKSISGYGLPMSLLLLKPELDIWKRGEHSGTFRGHNLAFISAAAALQIWRDVDLPRMVAERSAVLEQELVTLTRDFPQLGAEVRGLGLIFGLKLNSPEIAQAIASESFAGGLIIELCGARRDTLKFLPPLVIDLPVLREGLCILRKAIEVTLDYDESQLRIVLTDGPKLHKHNRSVVS